ncbi:MAG: hypothetical protein R2703_09645 [Micropruina glycogenica]
MAAPIIAPFLGGVLVRRSAWHWIFLINIPLGLIAVPIAIALVPQIRTPHQVRSVAGLGLGVDLVWVRWWG